MIIGILTFIFDIQLFSLIFLLSLIYFNYDKRIVILSFFLYSCFIGLVFLPLLLCFFCYKVKKQKSLTNYLLLICELIILFDVIFYLFLPLSNIFLLIRKLVITLPINIIYAILIYSYFSVLNDKKTKYKLV